MSLEERLERLEPRERRLLGILTGVFAVFIVILIPLGVTTLLGSRRADNDALKSAIDTLQESRERVHQAELERALVVKRYAQPAPPLAGFLDKAAKDNGIEIPESQDRPVVPHGKKYDERATKITLRKVGMLNLVKFMEKVEQSGHPVSISKLNIRKRGTEPDSYDVEVIVSAFDRKEDTGKKPAKGADDEAEL